MSPFEHAAGHGWSNLSIHGKIPVRNDILICLGFMEMKVFNEALMWQQQCLSCMHEISIHPLRAEWIVWGVAECRVVCPGCVKSMGDCWRRGKASSCCSDRTHRLHMGCILEHSYSERGLSADMWITLTRVLCCLWLQDSLHMRLTVDGQQTHMVCTLRDGSENVGWLVWMSQRERLP